VEAPQQCAGVEQLEGHAVGARVVDLPVVDVEHAGEVAQLQLEQREVPPVVHREEVAAAPVGDAALERVDPLGHPTTHLVGVGHGVDRPHVVPVGIERGHPGLLGRFVVAGLLEPEGLHAQHEAVVGVAGDGRQGPSDAVPQVLRVAREEVELVAELEGEQIGGPADQQVVEGIRGAVPAALDPLADGPPVGLLALAEVAGRHGLVGGHGHLDVALLGGHQVQVGHQGVAHGQAGVLRGEHGGVVDHLRLEREECVSMRASVPP
jgi:hypothetical protein